MQLENNILKQISDDKREQELALQREQYIMDQKAIEAAGFDKGAKSEKIKIAKSLLEQNIDINIIIKATGLKKQEIELLKK